MFKLLWRILLILLCVVLIRSVIIPQPPQAYIVWPEKPNWVDRVKVQVEQLQKDAQDLPTSVEVELRRLWKDIKPVNNAKEV